MITALGNQCFFHAQRRGKASEILLLWRIFMSEQNNDTVTTPGTAATAQPEQHTYIQTEHEAIILDWFRPIIT